MTGSRTIAVIWDYDGTLADTRHKNIKVTSRILKAVTGKDASHFPALRSLVAYQEANHRVFNWRELYRNEFGLDAAETERAGSMWTEFQRSDPTPVPLFEGIAETLHALAGTPHGIVSQNCSQQITAALTVHQIVARFAYVVGYAEVAPERQKPHPDGLLHCIERLTASTAGTVFYIGDHETDMRCAMEANRKLAGEGSAVRIVSIGALYGHGAGDHGAGWQAQPDYLAREPGDIVRIVRQLG